MLMTFGKALSASSQSMSGNADKLPVVEIKPFTKQEWRPSKSLPDFYDGRAQTSMSSASSATSIVTNRKTVGTGGLHSVKKGWTNERPTLTPRNSDLSKSVSLPERLVTGKAPKPKEGLLFEQRKLAFATSLEREKVTFDDIKSGQSDNVKYSFLRRAQSENDMNEYEGMKIHGTRIHSNNSSVNVLYASHWDYYKTSKSYSVPVTSVRGTSSRSGQTMEDLCLRIEHLQQAYVDDGIYDMFDRSYTLPSITVTNAPMRLKKYRRDNLMRQTSAKVSQKPAYRLGVANSLDVLSHYGKPVRVEKQLTMQLKNNINNIRRSKDSSFIGNASKITSKGNQEYVTTPGEYLLRMSLDGSLKTGDPSRQGGRTSHSNRTWSGEGGSLSSGNYMFDAGMDAYSMQDQRYSPQKSVKISSVSSNKHGEGPLFQRTGTLPYIHQASQSSQRRSVSAPDRPIIADLGGHPESVISAAGTEKMPKISEGGSKSPLNSDPPNSEKENAQEKVKTQKVRIQSPKSSASTTPELPAEPSKDANNKEEDNYDSDVSDALSLEEEMIQSFVATGQNLNSENGETEKPTRLDTQSASSHHSQMRLEEGAQKVQDQVHIEEQTVKDIS